MLRLLEKNFEFPLDKVQGFNWLLLALMVVAGGALHTVDFAKAVLVGGLLANLSFICLRRDLLKVMSGPLEVAKVRFFVKYYSRLSVLAVVLFLLVRYRAVHVVGLLVGLSTVALSIGITTAGLVTKVFFKAKEAT